MAIFASIAGLLVAVPAAPVFGASSSTDQHWELLAETKAITAPMAIPIQRGVLPGGTSKFDPPPTATLEVAGRHIAGQGQSHWDIKLSSNGSILATVPFYSNDSSFIVKTAAIAWPAMDKALTSIQVSKVNDGLSVAGSFELTKAYISIRQVGIIKKTVTRIALATKQVGITNTSWVDVADPVYYTHIAGDFNPLPAISLRTSGVEVTANPILMSLHVRLVNDSGSVVTGSENIHGAFGSLSSAPLSLVDGMRYHLQVNVTTVPESGELHSADLVLEQATADAEGTSKIVGWYAGVTAASPITLNNTYLNFPFSPPQLSAPFAVASWYTPIYRYNCSGAESTVGANLVNTGGTPIVSGVQTASSTYADVASDRDELPPGYDSTVSWDTRSDFSTGCAARLAASALRVVITTKPTPISGCCVQVGAQSNALGGNIGAAGNSTTTLPQTIVGDATAFYWVADTTELGEFIQVGWGTHGWSCGNDATRAFYFADAFDSAGNEFNPSDSDCGSPHNSVSHRYSVEFWGQLEGTPFMQWRTQVDWG